MFQKRGRSITKSLKDREASIRLLLVEGDPFIIYRVLLKIEAKGNRPTTTCRGIPPKTQ